MAKRAPDKNTRKDAINMVTKTLDHMFRGGIYDHVGGGFHRYSTDRKWLVPHFEKMLYDNALLATTYLEAAQLTSDKNYTKVAESVLDYILREMSHPQGGYYSAEDADSLPRHDSDYRERRPLVRPGNTPRGQRTEHATGIDAGGRLRTSGQSAHRIEFRRRARF